MILAVQSVLVRWASRGYRIVIVTVVLCCGWQICQINSQLFCAVVQAAVSASVRILWSLTLPSDRGRRNESWSGWTARSGASWYLTVSSREGCKVLWWVSMSVSLSVCLLACLEGCWMNFITFTVHVDCVRGSVLLRSCHVFTQRALWHVMYC